MSVCHYCRGDVNPLSPQTWQAVVGWERKATGTTRKGGSDIACRENRPVFACDTCIRRKKRGLSPTQEAML